MKCDHAVQLCACCICGCTVHTLPSVDWRFFSRQPKPVLTLRKKNTNRQGLKNAENSNCSSFNGFGPTLTTMTKLSASWPTTLTKLSAGFTRDPLRNLQTVFWVNRVVIFFVGPQIAVLFAVLFVDCEEWF